MHKTARILVVVLSGVLLLVTLRRAVAQDVGFFPDTTYKIVQLTGGTDQTRRIPTLSRMDNYCVSGTDLGSTFEHNGQLYFLFGDTSGFGDGFSDFMAWTDASRPEGALLNVFKDGACFHPIAVPNVSMGCCEVPSYGISVGGRMYVVVTTDGNCVPCSMGRSVMAVSDDDGKNFQNLYDLSALTNGGKFINVSMVEVDGRQFPNLPAEQCVLIWGSGLYRASDVCLAYVPSAQITNKSAIHYLRAIQGGTPQWSTNEADAMDLFNQPAIGEFSVQYCQELAQWIMLYSAPSPRGINMRSAGLPWGPWSAQPTIIFEPTRDRAYGRYMHVSTDAGQWDVFSDSRNGRAQTDWGGEYGPYLIPRFFKGDENRVKIVYSMSTWNPYQAILMQSDIGYPDRVQPEVITSSTTLPGDTNAGWAVSGNFLRGFFWTNGLPYVTSYADNGDADMGVAQYGFLAACSDQALEFSVHGGDAEVVLIEQTQIVPTNITDVPAFYSALKSDQLYGPVVETIIGPQSNDHDLTVRWDLRRHRGKMMRLFVVDWLNQAWGFITVSQVTRFFVNATEPVNIYVDRSNLPGPFLGTPGYPFLTVTAGYNAATDSACSVNVLKIRAGIYAETLTMNKAVTLDAEGGSATVGR